MGTADASGLISSAVVEEEVQAGECPEIPEISLAERKAVHGLLFFDDESSLPDAVWSPAKKDQMDWRTLTASVSGAGEGGLRACQSTRSPLAGHLHKDSPFSPVRGEAEWHRAEASEWQRHGTSTNWMRESVVRDLEVLDAEEECCLGALVVSRDNHGLNLSKTTRQPRTADGIWKNSNSDASHASTTPEDGNSGSHSPASSCPDSFASAQVAICQVVTADGFGQSCSSLEQEHLPGRLRSAGSVTEECADSNDESASGSGRNTPGTAAAEDAGSARPDATPRLTDFKRDSPAYDAAGRPTMTRLPDVARRVEMQPAVMPPLPARSAKSGGKARAPRRPLPSSATSRSPPSVSPLRSVDVPGATLSEKARLESLLLGRQDTSDRAPAKCNFHRGARAGLVSRQGALDLADLRAGGPTRNAASPDSSATVHDAVTHDASEQGSIVSGRVTGQLDGAPRSIVRGSGQQRRGGPRGHSAVSRNVTPATAPATVSASTQAPSIPTRQQCAASEGSAHGLCLGGRALGGRGVPSAASA